MRLFVATTVLVFSAAHAAEQGREIPAQFIADRVFVVPQTATGESIRFYSDTGGATFIGEDAAKRLRLATQTVGSDSADDKNAPQQTIATLPTFKKGFDIPLPDNEGKIRVAPAELIAKNHLDSEGMLGEAWFGGHVWTWNYPAGTLRMEDANFHADPKSAKVSLGFPVENGQRADNFARIAIAVDGKSIDMLLDTGAMTELTPDASKALGDKLPATRATSFIVDAIFKQWHAAHPDWRVIEQAEMRTKSDMIEVPDVEIAGAHVGPVWFTHRPDSAFHDFMSGMMDKRVEGAIGGDAFRHFVMTIDYPKAVAYFRCVKDCNPATPKSAP
jgi:hypothetical protein